MESTMLNRNDEKEKPAKIGADFGLLKAIDKVRLSRRAATLKHLYLTSTPMLVAERIPFTIEAWKESEGDPLDLRWAKMAKKCLENDANYLNELLDEDIAKITIGGDVEKADIENLALMKEAAAFFKNKSLVEMAQKAINAAMGDWDDLECQ